MRALVPAFRYLSPAGRRGRLSILIFHRVLPEPDPLFPETPDARRFARILLRLKSWFNVIPLDDAADLLAHGTLPERAAVITFDDGYADNYTIAMPLLKAHGLPALFFVATGFLDGGRMWNDTIIEAIRRSRLGIVDLSSVGLSRLALGTIPERRAVIERCIAALKYLPPERRMADTERIAAATGAMLPSDLMLSSHQVLALHRDGMGIGAHTVSHPILTRLPADAARAEMTEAERISRPCSTRPSRASRTPTASSTTTMLWSTPRWCATSDSRSAYRPIQALRARVPISCNCRASRRGSADRCASGGGFSQTSRRHGTAQAMPPVGAKEGCIEATSISGRCGGQPRGNALGGLGRHAAEEQAGPGAGARQVVALDPGLQHGAQHRHVRVIGDWREEHHRLLGNHL